jgi:hypothetical protein
MWKLLARLIRRDRAPKPPTPQPRHQRRRDPHEPLHYDHGSPPQRWLFGIDEPRKQHEHRDSDDDE